MASRKLVRGIGLYGFSLICFGGLFHLPVQGCWLCFSLRFQFDWLFMLVLFLLFLFLYAIRTFCLEERVGNSHQGF